MLKELKNSKTKKITKTKEINKVKVNKVKKRIRNK